MSVYSVTLALKVTLSNHFEFILELAKNNMKNFRVNQLVQCQKNYHCYSLYIELIHTFVAYVQESPLIWPISSHIL